jgi:hypothetical protein
VAHQPTVVPVIGKKRVSAAEKKRMKKQGNAGGVSGGEGDIVPSKMARQQKVKKSSTYDKYANRGGL